MISLNTTNISIYGQVLREKGLPGSEECGWRPIEAVSVAGEAMEAACMYLCMYVCMYVSKYVCMYVCIS